MEPSRDLPSGTVTFVFTDIEGSTRLLRELGDLYAEALAEQRRLVRLAFGANGGIEVDTQGDAFFYVFRDAKDAIAGARAGQAALEPGPIRVRIGVHTGTPVVTGEGYVGLEVHRGARIAAAGHGGQVVFSRSTRELLDDVEVVDLGQHHVKDFDEPVWLFQLGDRRFPPLKTIANTNLPWLASSFVGRAPELAAITGLLRENRLVTLTGPGGSGKTRLAIEAASELVGDFIHGVFWVELSAIQDPALVMPAVDQAIGAGGNLAAEIGDKHVLLLLDNLEQVIVAASSIAALIETCPNLCVLVTSRERLRVRGEVEFDVQPLAKADAVELFCARAQIPPDPVVEELCRRLDNMPLAVELAAARARVLSPGQILDRLGRRLDLFQGGRDADPRQSSLRATIEWSHDLLDPADQALFAHLAVFTGGCTIDAAEEVCDADIDGLQSLVDKSLIRHSLDRFWMLETIREYAAERLALADESAEIRQKHADWIIRFGQGLSVRRADQDAVLRQLRAEMPNVRVGLDHLILNGESTGRLSIVTALAQAMFQLGATYESRIWLEDALGACAACPPELRALAFAEVSMQSTFTGDAEAGAQYAAQAAELAPAANDAQLSSDVFLAIGVAEIGRGNFDAAERATVQALALAEDLGDRSRIGDLRNNLSYIALCTGNLELARTTAEAALIDSLARQDYHNAAVLHHNLSLAAIKSDAPEAAVKHLEDALLLCRSHGFESLVCACVEAVALMAARDGNHQLAATLLGATANAFRAAGPLEDELRLSATTMARSALGDRGFDECAAIGASSDLEGAAVQATDWLASAAHEPRTAQ